MSPLERVVLIVSSDSDFTQELVRELALGAGGEESEGPCQAPIAASFAQAQLRIRRARPVVIVLDADVVRAAGIVAAAADAIEPGLIAAVEDFLSTAPVIVVGPAEEQRTLAPLVAKGEVDFIVRSGDFLPLVLGLIERRLRAAAFAAMPAAGSEEFAEILRHEVNNPLTGILGNAELLLGRHWRDRLPPAAIQRLETIAELAVRLRETVRRLSSANGTDGRSARRLHSS